ncbi:MAG: helix-turn-helix transcriptional regulator [Aquabacterium sp.]
MQSGTDIDLAAAAGPTVIKRTLFESALLEVGHIEVRPTSDACGEIETADLNVLALPLGGVFAVHEGPRQQTLAVPGHALVITAHRPYRLSFPGCIGDRCLAVRFSAPALARTMPEVMAGDGFDRSAYLSRAPLPASLLLARSQLWRRLARGPVDALEAEELAVNLLDGALQGMRRRGLPGGDVRRGRRRPELSRRQVHRTMEAIWCAPAHKWTLDGLARRAHVSASHLAHVFRAEVGMPLYAYVVRARLTQALDSVLDSDADLTTIALDLGFASHSHFTSRFRALYGQTPQALRRGVAPPVARQLRRIVTAPALVAA